MGDSLCSLRFILPQIPQIFTDFIYPRIRVHPRYLWKTSPHPISVFICDICGRFPLQLEIYSPTDSTDIHRFYISHYPCSSVLSVGDSLCCLRFILPLIPQIFTDFIYSNIRAPLCYLWETPSHPISVFICAICGRFLRTLTYVGDSLCCLRFILPRIPQISQILYIHVSVFICAICGRFLRTLTYVGDSLCCLRFILPRIPQIFRFYISYVLSVRDSFLRCICGNLTKSIAIDFSNDTIINVICIEINKDTDMLFGEAKISKQLLMMYWF